MFVAIYPVHVGRDVVLDVADDRLVPLHVKCFAIRDPFVEHYNKKDFDTPVLVLLLVCLELVQVDPCLGISHRLVD